MDFLHLHCGDCSAHAQEAAAMPGEILVWREIYTEGRLACLLDLEEWISMRAQYLASRFDVVTDDVARHMRAGYGKIRDFTGEIVFWADPCMFDQMFLAHLLWFIRLNRGEGGVSVVQIANPRGGFSDCDSAAMRELFSKRTTLSLEDLGRASDLWAAFCSDTPMPLHGLSLVKNDSLPFAAAAAGRHLRQLPSVKNGLGLLEWEILRALSSGPLDLPALFKAVSAMEKIPFFGDTSLWAMVDDLCRWERPLLRASGPFPIRELANPCSQKPAAEISAALTDDGVAVLDGKADALELGSLTRWVGGVLVGGEGRVWRWDESARKPVKV